jgi:hypothetical protein
MHVRVWFCSSDAAQRRRERTGVHARESRFMMMMRIRRAAILKAKVVISFLAADMAEILISIEKILVLV